MPDSILVEAGKSYTKMLLKNDNNYNLNLEMEFNKDNSSEVKNTLDDLH